MQEPTQRFAEDAVPALHRVHLLRGSPQLSEEAGDAHIGPSRLALLAMRAADPQRDLPSVARLSRDGLQQQRSAGNRLAPMIRISQAHEQAPPVINQGNAAGEQAAALQILRREPAPTPLVLQLVEPILAVRPIAIQLTQAQNFAVQRGDQRGRPRRSSSDHSPSDACLTLCWSPGCTSTLSTRRSVDIM